MIFGLDYLGGAKYTDAIIHEHPMGFAAGFFLNTFGDARPTIDKLLATGRCPFVRIQILYKPNHDYSKADIPAAKMGIKSLKPLMTKYPEVEFAISPCCEHRMSFEDAMGFYEATDPLFPGNRIVKYINSPVDSGALLKSTSFLLNEYHGGGKPKDYEFFSFSYDGTNCVDANITKDLKSFAGAEYFFFWVPRFNGRWKTTDNTPIAQRQGWPDTKLIDSIACLAHGKGLVNLSKNWLYKTHAENNGDGDPRAEHPVIISPIKTKLINLKTTDGRVVQNFSYYGSYVDGRYRYYARDWGYQIADKATRIQGIPICSIWANHKQYGTVNPAFRENEWR